MRPRPRLPHGARAHVLTPAQWASAQCRTRASADGRNAAGGGEVGCEGRPHAQARASRPPHTRPITGLGGRVAVGAMGCAAHCLGLDDVFIKPPCQVFWGRSQMSTAQRAKSCAGPVCWYMYLASYWCTAVPHLPHSWCPCRRRAAAGSGALRDGELREHLPVLPSMPSGKCTSGLGADSWRAGAPIACEHPPSLLPSESSGCERAPRALRARAEPQPAAGR